MAAFASLQALRDHLNITSTANDGELTLMLEAAEGVVRSLIGSRFPASTVSERVVSNGGTVILSGRHVDDVQLNGGAVTGFTVNRAAGLLYDVPYTSDPLTASYTQGGGGVPAEITLATLIIAEHGWQTQRGTSPSALALQGDDVSLGVPGLGYAIPNRARDYLAPYINASQIA